MIHANYHQLLYTFDLSIYNQPSTYVVKAHQYFTIYNDAYMGSLYNRSYQSRYQNTSGPNGIFSFGYSVYRPLSNAR
jgi:hypothetical protein